MAKPYPGAGYYFAVMDLSGRWCAAVADDDLRRAFPRPGFDDSGWEPVDVPGHWRQAASLANTDGPVLYRHGFSHEALSPGQRGWLVLDGVFYQSYVWMDGSYLGDTEGYFVPHAFDVTGVLARGRDHVIGVEVACPVSTPGEAKTALLGVFSDPGCIGPSFNPGGLWALVHMDVTGPVRVGPLTASCRTATSQRAVLDITAELDSARPARAAVTLALRGPDGAVVAEADLAQPLAGGPNRATWQLEVLAPQLWWPRRLGEQPIYQLDVHVSVDGALSDSRTLRTGLRSVRARDFVWSVNGERLFLKGADLLPTQAALAAATDAQVRRDVDLALEGGLDLLRVRAHIGRPELYDQADASGLLLWQDMPLYGRYGNVRAEAARQAGQAVALLSHHPSIVAWGADSSASGAAGPRWREDGLDNVRLDRSACRSLQKADPSRPAVSSGAGWWSPVARGWPRRTATSRYQSPARLAGRTTMRGWSRGAAFVLELGAPAVPVQASFARPENWPELDWEELVRNFCLPRALLERLEPGAGYPTFDDWRDATQHYQAEIVKYQVEAVRRLKYKPTGGFSVAYLNDAQPALSWSLLDHDRSPKLAWSELVAACRDVAVTADLPPSAWRVGDYVDLAVHVVNDSRQDLGEARAQLEARWPGGGRRWQWAGKVPKDSCTQAGTARWQVPLPAGPGPWDLHIDLSLTWDGGAASNHYSSSVQARGRQPSSPG